MGWPRRLLGFCVAALIAGCAPSSAQGPSDVTSTAPFASAVAGGSPSKEQVDDAVRLRTSLGLRADRRFVEALFSDAAAVERGNASAYLMPLTAQELDRLTTQKRTADEIIGEVLGYAGTVRGAWAGLYIERPSGDVIASFKRPIAPHEEALKPLLAMNAPLRLVEVEYSLIELDRLRDKIHDDLSWLSSVDADLLQLGVSEVTNRVTFVIRSARPDIVDVIHARYGESPMLDLQIDPHAPWAGGHGSLVVIAEYDDGSPVMDHHCVVVPDDPAAGSDQLRSTHDHGRCRFPGVPATTVLVTLTRPGDPAVLAAEKLMVAKGEQTTVRITIHR